jgi:hypothetical protein
MSKSEALPQLKQRRWREADARVVVDSWRSSGDSLAAFCERHKLKLHRVERWARHFNDGSIKFHPVELVRTAEREPNTFVEVEMPRGETVRVPAGFELDDLRRVLVALDERA